MIKSKLTAGLLAGLVPGILLGLAFYGIDLQTASGTIIPSISALGDLVKRPSMQWSWAVQVVASLVAGIIFAAIARDTLHSYKRAVAAGAVYGAVSWVIGALLAMPHAVGLHLFEPITNRAYASFAGETLVAYVVAGIILGALFRKFHTTVKIEKTERRAAVGV